MDDEEEEGEEGEELLDTLLELADEVEEGATPRRPAGEAHLCEGSGVILDESLLWQVVEGPPADKQEDAGRGGEGRGATLTVAGNAARGAP